MNHIFVTGTDTGVGKTLISSLIMNFFKKKNKNSIYLKLIQTGCHDVCHDDSDAYFVYNNLMRKVDRGFLLDKVCYLFKNPKAPYFAARDENKEIDINYLTEWIIKRTRGYDRVVLEGAGGLMVPITRDFLVIDLINLLRTHVILVARASLGTINHTLLSIEALKKRDIPVLGVIFSMKKKEHKNLVEENMEAISMFSGVKVYLVEEIKDPSIDCEDYFGLIEELEDKMVLNRA